MSNLLANILDILYICVSVLVLGRACLYARLVRTRPEPRDAIQAFPHFKERLYFTSLLK